MSEKTEQPTPKKLEDARKKGQVAHSKDFTQNVLMLALFAYLLSVAGTLARELASWLVMPLAFLQQPFSQAWPAVLWPVLGGAVLVLLPFIGLVLGVGGLTEAVQVGFLVAFQAIKPSGKKLNVLSNLKNMFSKKTLVEFLKNIVKTTSLSILVYIVIRDEMRQLLTLPLGEVEGVGFAILALLRTIIVNVAVIYTLLSLADLLWQRHSHTKQLMMDKNEVKQEHKQLEGDPHIKHKRKHLHREMAQSGIEKVRKASVLVTNPTHVAVALLYEPGQTPLPLVLAVGTDALALHMIAVGREAGVTVIQNVPLARALLKQANVDDYIPAALIEPVAEVLRLVAQLGDGAVLPSTS